MKGYLDELTGDGGSFAGVRDAIVGVNLDDVNVTNAKLYLLSVGEANADNMSDAVRKAGVHWWLRSPGSKGGRAAYVGSEGDVDDSGRNVSHGLGVRPACRLNLASVIFESQSKAFLLKVSATGVSLNKSATTISVGDAES